MALIVDATEDRSESTTQRTDEAASDRRRIDVSDLPADEIEEFVSTNVTTECVSLEHCGAKTYLVVEE